MTAQMWHKFRGWGVAMPGRLSDYSQRLIKNPVIIGILIIFLGHAALVFNFCPDWPDLVKNQHFLNHDYNLHYYCCYTTSLFIKSSLHFWGYDPFFQAGYPASALADLSSKLWEIFVCLFSFIGEARAFNLYTILSFLVVPLILFKTARNLGLSSAIGLFLTFFGCLYWWFSLLREMVYLGVTSYVITVYLALLTYSYWHRFLQKEGRADYIWFLVYASLLWALHFVAPVIILIPCAVAYLLKCRNLQRKTQWWIWLSPVILFLGAYATWLHGFITFMEYKNPLVVPFYKSNDFWTFLKDYFTDVHYFTFLWAPSIKHIRLVILILGIFGAVDLRRKKSYDELLPLFCGSIFLFGLSYFGSLASFTASLQPLRFKHAFDVMWLILGGYGARALTHYLIERIGKKTFRMALLLLVLTLVPVYYPVVANEIKSPVRLENVPTDYSLGVIQWINQNTNRQGRILFEDVGEEEKAIVFNKPVAATLPLFAKREYVGGPYPYAYDKHHFVDFHSSILFGKPINTVSRQQFLDYIELYNLKWIICYTPTSKQYLGNYEDIVKYQGEFSVYAFYEIVREPSFISGGHGSVMADYNRLEVNLDQPGTVTLRYHLLKTMRSEPPLRLESVKLLDDPIGFIKVIDAPTHFVISNN
jgi:hypothetical protein